MSHLDQKRPPSRAELRKFALVVGGAFLAFGVTTLLHHRPPALFGPLLGLGGALALAGLAIPQTLRPVYANWMRLGELLSRVTTPIVMAVVYFLVLTPIAILMRLARPKPTAGTGRSAWEARPKGQRASALERQF